MGQWEDKLGAILNDPQAMSQIMSLAQSLGAGGADPAPEPPAQEAAPAPAQEAGPADSPAPELDPRLLEAGMRALSVWRDPNDPRAKLLQALRPFLREERQAELDRAIRVTRLTKAIRAALGESKGGATGDV